MSKSSYQFTLLNFDNPAEKVLFLNLTMIDALLCSNTTCIFLPAQYAERL
jgi:hypothetical protein